MQCPLFLSFIFLCLPLQASSNPLSNCPQLFLVISLPTNEAPNLALPNPCLCDCLANLDHRRTFWCRPRSRRIHRRIRHSRSRPRRYLPFAPRTRRRRRAPLRAPSLVRSTLALRLGYLSHQRQTPRRAPANFHHILFSRCTLGHDSRLDSLRRSHPRPRRPRTSSPSSPSQQLALASCGVFLLARPSTNSRRRRASRAPAARLAAISRHRMALCRLRRSLVPQQFPLYRRSRRTRLARISSPSPPAALLSSRSESPGLVPLGPLARPAGLPPPISLRSSGLPPNPCSLPHPHHHPPHLVLQPLQLQPPHHRHLPLLHEHLPLRPPLLSTRFCPGYPLRRRG